jgi:hypothetical protein
MNFIRLQVGASLLLVGYFLAAPSLLSRLDAQEVTVEDYQKLRFNEIISSNRFTPPQNWACDHVDMIEIYNGSDKDLPLSGALGHIRFTDHSVTGLGLLTRFFSFRGQSVSVIDAGSRIVVFCDGFASFQNRTPECAAMRVPLDQLEMHSTFRLSSNGERVTLEFVPADASQDPIVVHDVCFPAIRRDHSYTRIPESPENLDGWVISATPTFGECAVPDVRPPGGQERALCIGEENATMAGIEGDPLPPDLERIGYATNDVKADEAVDFHVRITDDKTPDAAGLPTVQIRYHVDGGEEQKAPMTFVDLLTETIDPTGPGGERADCPASGLDTWSIWEGSIPGQAAGALVQFQFFVEDSDGLTDLVPGPVLCAPGVGPCSSTDLEPFLGPGCTLGEECDTLLNYGVATESDIALVINEVVPSNDATLADPSETQLACNVSSPNCRFDDFMEIFNASDAEQSLDNIVIARGPFHPERGWRFPAGATIDAGGYRIVWVDNDGKDPKDSSIDPPNPNDVLKNWFHTDFGVVADRDELFLYEIDEAAEGGPIYRRVDGVRWGTSGRYFSSNLRQEPDVTPLTLAASDGTTQSMLVDQSVARSPNGSSSSAFKVFNREDITPAGPNPGSGEVVFRRGDVDASGVADITDALLILLFQFLGDPIGCQDAADVDDSGALDVSDPLNLLIALFIGTPPVPAPGLADCGPDPTDDGLPTCVYAAEMCQ